MVPLSISIITINYNDSQGLEKTIKSVTEQTFQNIQYIVIDGGSTDDSVNVIKNNSHKITYWVSEKDNGIYHAMNKGIEKANGNYLLFLNSGDYLIAPDVLEKVIPSLKYDIVYCEVLLSENGVQKVEKFPSKLSFGYFIYNSLPHCSSFIKRELFLIEKYDENVKISSDWKFFVDSICKNNASYKHLDFPITNYNMNGISSLPHNREVIRNECYRHLENNYGIFFDDYLKMIEYERLVKSFKNSRVFNLLRKFGLFSFFKRW